MKQNNFSEREFTAKSTLDINALKAELMNPTNSIRNKVANEVREFKESKAKRNTPRVFIKESIYGKNKQTLFVVEREEYFIDRWYLVGYMCNGNGEWYEAEMALAAVAKKMALGTMTQIQ